MNQKKLLATNMRARFAHELYLQMRKNQDIYVLTSDLGYKMWDKVKSDFPKRFLNTGASEQALIGIGIGLALTGKIPIVYSITPFLLYRPFETIRNYIHHEKIPVRLVGSGRNRDYSHDGISHWSEEDKKVMKIFKHIKSFWPESVEEIPHLVSKIIEENKPFYINLKR